ncbi:AAA family ATPase [Roseovarius pelagicus]|uniref:AAA family ATPase n=1 Tax=Roseovarius pelagicus TaxID=2980108 RepID=A0ABY6DE43_9RHOB|nr:AAA family ATPase [Roseovarius pelagicus]UXX83805.1 AAA family ATPase [Roseovarius pelagicus]
MSDMISKAELLWLHSIRDRVKEDMNGIDGIINLLLVAMVVRGHVLLEGNPGLGKTALIRSLSAAMDFPREDVGRIQFTPDLMPSDITGTKMPDDEGRLVFQPGPIFCRLLLADEINRATPKTQAAMLEAMAEFQVTVLGQRYALAEPKEVRDGTSMTVHPPFMVMATQNPVEQEGTYELPEAQLDRFLFKAVMPFPKRDTLSAIIAKDTGAGRDGDSDKDRPRWSMDQSLANLHRLGRGLRATTPNADVQTHILNIVMASVGDFDGVQGVAGVTLEKLREFRRDRLRYELGPRAATSLTLATLGWAAVHEIDPGEPSQLPVKTTQALAKVALPVLRHRMKFDIPYDQSGREADTHDNLVREFVAICAPAREGYDAEFRAALNQASNMARF